VVAMSTRGAITSARPLPFTFYRERCYYCYVVAINRCVSSDDPPCHEHARCVFTGPSQFDCVCQPNYHGDGLVCRPVDPCQHDAGGCPVESTRCVYVGPGQV